MRTQKANCKTTARNSGRGRGRATRLEGKTPAQAGCLVLLGAEVKLLKFGATSHRLSLFYCMSIDLEMLSDTCVRTEQWFADNVPRPTMVGAGIYNRICTPRLHLKAHDVSCPCKSSSTPARTSSYRDYLRMSPDWQRGKEDAEYEFRKELSGGQLSYEQAARFTPKYLCPARDIFGLAGGDIGQRRGADPKR